MGNKVPETRPFVLLDELEKQTGLPMDYLQELLENKSLPGLRVAGVWYCDPVAVSEALGHLADRRRGTRWK